MAGSGVSPVLASLLLVVIAVAAALATYVWVSSYLRSAERGVEAPQFRELLKVEGVRAGDGGVIVTVRNIGSAKLVLRAVYVLKGDVAVAAEKLDLELEPGQVADVRVGAGVQPGDYTVKVVTATGVEASARLTLSGTTRQPKFLIVSWSLDVAGPVSSKRGFSSVIENVGSGGGSVRVEVRDHNGALINSSTLTLQPGGQGSVELTITLPSSRGAYTWTVVAVNEVTGEIDDSKSFTVYAMDLYLNVRGAICYAPFESLPADWGSIGGTWSIVSGGVEGNALQGVDDSRGPGGTSVYYWTTSISAYTSLRAVVQVRVTSVDRVYRGFVLLQGTNNKSWLYEVYVRPVLLLQTNQIRVAISKWLGQPNTWRTLASQTVPYAPGWYTLYVSWNRSGTENTINEVFYDSSGNQIASVLASDSDVTVNYFGLDVDGGTGLFDNFVLATSDPRYVVVSGLQQGWSVELRDSGGVLVASAMADSSGVARLFVVAKPIVPNARIAVKDSLGNVVVEKGFSEVVGGDEYAYGP